MRRQPFPVAAAFNDDLIAGVGQAIEGAVAQYGILEQSQPLLDSTVAGDDEAGRAVPVEDELVQVGRLLGSEPVQAQVVQDQQVRRRGRSGSCAPGSCRLWPRS